MLTFAKDNESKFKIKSIDNTTFSNVPRIFLCAILQYKEYSIQNPEGDSLSVTHKQRTMCV